MILAVTDPALRDQLMEINRRIGGWEEGFDPFFGAPVLLIALGKKDSPYAVQDASLAMGNMMLAAYALGYGSCWINRAAETFALEEGKAILRKLGIQEELVGVGHCILGYQEGETPPAKDRLPRRVFWAE